MNIPSLPFEHFAKIARLNRDAIVTEKLDGTNATVYVDKGTVFAASKNRWITPDDDNFGFAAWVDIHTDELRLLGDGLHRGEWWGQGIQRGYGLKEKRFSLFNTIRWCLHGHEPGLIPCGDPRIVKYQDVLPPCIGLVPVLRYGPFSTEACRSALYELASQGSVAAPGYMNPEGIVVWHTAANIGFKATIKNDEQPKGKL